MIIIYKLDFTHFAPPLGDGLNQMYLLFFDYSFVLIFGIEIHFINQFIVNKITTTSMAEFIYEKPFQIEKDSTTYRLLTKDYVKVVEEGGQKDSES